jgi:hypothetical protein
MSHIIPDPLKKHLYFLLSSLSKPDIMVLSSMNISQKRSHIIKKPTRPPHFSRCENKMAFVEAYEFLSDNADMIFYSTGNKTPFIAKATIGIKGSHKNKKVIRFFTKGTEKARAYSCCWGHITNCAYSAEVDHLFRLIPSS